MMYSMQFPSLEKVGEPYKTKLQVLFRTWNDVLARNARLSRYYDMKNELKELGISIPKGFINVRCVVGWCKKAVDAHAVRSVFDGYVFKGKKDDVLDSLVRENRLRSLISQLGRSQRVHGIAFATVMHGKRGQPTAKVRVYSANQACGTWNKDENRLDCGIVLVDVDDRGNATKYVAHFEDAVITFTRDGSDWSVDKEDNPLGQPMMVAFPFDPDLDRPMGHSLITPEVMGITDKAMRDVLRMECGSEFFTFPQRYMLGVAEDLFGGSAKGDDDEDESSDEDETVDMAEAINVSGNTDMAKFKAYMGAILAISRDENGDIPQVGEFSASPATNFTAVFENDAQRFSGATNVPLAQLGVLSNNYTSSDALGAANDPLILSVEDTNRINGEALEDLALMMMAIANDTTIDGLTPEQKSVQAAWKDPSMPTIAARADAWSKLGSADKDIVGTRVYYEGIGLSQATIDRVEQEKERNGALVQLGAIAAGLGD